MKYTTNINYISTLVSAFILASCDNKPVTPLQPLPEDEVVEEGIFQQTIKSLEAKAPDFIPVGSTRVDRMYDGNALGFYWNDGDCLGFWPDQSDVHFGTPQQASFIINADNDICSDAVFEACGWGLLKRRRYYAYYPYDNMGTFNMVNVSYSGQRQISNASVGHLGAYDHMYSYIDVPANGDMPTMVFNHFDCIEMFRLMIPQDWRGVGFTDFVMSTASDVIVTEASFNPSSVSPQLAVSRRESQFRMALGAEGDNGIMCDANGILTLFMMMCPDDKWLSETVNITLYDTAGDQYIGSFRPTISQRAGKLYEFSSSMVHHGPERINLSRSETANCYVVSEAGDYKFKATKGNSSETVTPGSVRLLWESDNTTTAPLLNSIIKSNVAYSNGYILFSTADNFKEGNALIAAYSGSDGTGDILWSWHIWCTDCPADQTYFNDAGILMDRNLGALSTSGNLANGLLYQWGRKDPFTGSATTSSAREMAANGCGITAELQNPSRNTLDYSIKHPTTFIGASQNNGDWLASNPKVGFDWQLSNPKEDISLWYGGPDVKTKYDPCPPGYCVPYSGTTVNEPDFWGKSYGGETNRFIGTSNSFSLGGKAASYNANSGLHMPTMDAGTSFYPMAGYVSEQGQRYNDGKHMMIWTNFPAGRDNAGNWNVQYSACLDLNIADSHVLTTHWNSCRAAGKSIRCMKMKRNVTAQSETGNEGFGTPIKSTW